MMLVPFDASDSLPKCFAFANHFMNYGHMFAPRIEVSVQRPVVADGRAQPRGAPQAMKQHAICA